jgi:hypothetical protein
MHSTARRQTGHARTPTGSATTENTNFLTKHNYEKERTCQSRESNLELRVSSALKRQLSDRKTPTGVKRTNDYKAAYGREGANLKSPVGGGVPKSGGVYAPIISGGRPIEALGEPQSKAHFEKGPSNDRGGQRD